MKIFRLILLAGCMLLLADITTGFSGNLKKPAVAGKGFAVVELFTSEGCSSCPPADALVGRIQKEYADQPVYILAYHVDYWNRLGWRDQFSSAAYSQRQSRYSEWMRSSSVYTPQIVVNGRKEFIGSEEGTLRNAIKAGEQKSASAQLLLSDVKLAQGQVNCQYHVEGNTGDNAAVVFAIVQKAAQSKVEAGENSGRTLAHVQIVRQLQSVILNGKSTGSAKIDLPKGLNPRDLEIIAFLQNQTDGEITAAAKSGLDANKIVML